MAERRNQERSNLGNTGRPRVGAPGTTGAFRTSDPLGAPGSTGAGMAHDPTAIPSVGSDYADPDLNYGGGQHQQLRDPTSGDYGVGYQRQFDDPTSGVYEGGQHQQLRDPTSGGVYEGGQRQQLGDPTSGDYGEGQQQQLRDLTTGVYGGVQKQQQLRDPTSGVIGSGNELERDRAGHGPVGVTGFTKITTATAPGGGVMYGRETVARAEELESAGAGGDETDVAAERAKEMKDRVQRGGTHNR